MIYTILTGGACSTWAAKLGFEAGTAMHFAVQAGFVGLCSQAAASLVANKGDPFKTIESLVSVDTVKSLATSMLSAGVIAKIASGLNVDITKLSKSDFC